MAVPYTFANTPVGTYLQLINLDANFSYLTNTPTLLGLTVANTLTVNGASIFSGSALFNNISINGAITIHGNTFNPTGVTGTGDIVLNNSPVLVTPNLGVPSSLDLSNATNLPISRVIGIQPSIYPFLATPNSANLRAAVVDETGTGALVFADGPTLVAPNLGTPASGNLANCTGYPATAITGVLPIANGGTGLSALGTGVQSALGIAVNSANGFAVLNGSGVLPIAQGGTGAATAPLALNNLLPTQTGNDGKFLMTDGAGNPAWVFAIRDVLNIAALRALAPVQDEQVSVAGYYTAADDGGGIFIGTTSGGPYTDNGGTIIVPGGGSGPAAWLRINDGDINVRWFGAAGDGVADDTASIQKAINVLSSYGTLIFPSGTYILTSASQTTSALTFAGKSNITLLGYGALIKGTTTRVKSYFDFSSTSGVKIYGFSFDMMFGTLPQYLAADYPTNYNVSIYTTTSAKNIEIYYCNFSNLYTCAVYCYSAGGTLIVDHCNFTSPVQDQGQNCQHISVVTWVSVTITTCTFINAPFPTASVGVPSILLAGITGPVLVSDNRIDYSGRDRTFPHPLGAIDFYQSVPYFTVSNNTVTNCAESIMRIDSCKDGRVEGNYFTIAGNAATGYNGIYAQGYYAGKTTNLIISNNVIEDQFNRLGAAIAILAYSWNEPSTNIDIYSNDIRGSNYALVVYNAFSNVAFRNNSLYEYNSRIRVAKVFSEPYAAYPIGNEANAAMTNFIVEGNTINGYYAAASSLISFEAYGQSTYTQTGTTTVTFTAPYQVYTVGTSIGLRFIQTAGAGPVPATGTYVITGVANSGLANASFTVTAATAATSSGIANVGFLGAVGDMRIQNNKLIGSGTAGFLGVYIDCLQASNTAYVYLQNNLSANLDIHYYVRNTYRTDMFNNSAQGAFTSFLINGGNNYYLQRRFNSVSSESRQGTRTLVAGTATVATAEIEAGDTVIVSRGTAGGTLGNLSVASIVPGSSFVINSDSATDTSTVFWEIVH
jgi:hypothetical protein